MKDIMDAYGMTDLKDMDKFECLDLAYKRKGDKGLDIARDYWSMKEDKDDLKLRTILSILLFISSLLLLFCAIGNYYEKSKESLLVMFLAIPVFLMARKLFKNRKKIDTYKKQIPTLVINILAMILSFAVGLMPAIAIGIVILILSSFGLGGKSKSSTLENLFIFRLLF